MERLRGIGYTRVSSEEQASTGVSLAAQRERIVAYSALRDIDLLDVVEDAAVSGAKPLLSRPGGGRLAAALRSGVKAVIVTKLDRAFRDAADALTTTRAWDRTGVALHIIDLGGVSVDSQSAAGRFMLTVLAGAAEMERGLIRERTRAALAHLRAHGRVTNHAHFGVELRDGRLAPQQDELTTVRRILALRAAGASLRRIAAILALEGRATKRHGAWAPETVRKILRRHSSEANRTVAAVNAGTCVDSAGRNG